MMAKKQKFFKNLLASSAIASVVASLGSSNVAFGVAVEHGVLMIDDATLNNTVDGGQNHWNDIDQNGEVVDPANFVDALWDNDALTYGGGFELTANRENAIITAINLAGNNGTLMVNENLLIGSIVPDAHNAGAGDAARLAPTIEAGKRLTLTGTPAAADQHGFAALANTYTGLGDVTLAGEGSTLVVHSTDGRDIVVGNVLADTNHQGVLTFVTSGSVGAIGADDHRLLTVNICNVGPRGGGATVTLNGDVYADEIKFTRTTSILNVGDGRTINSNILNAVGRNNKGTLTFLGAGRVIGNIGVDGAALGNINIGNGEVTLNGNVYAENTKLTDAASILKLTAGHTITGNVVTTVGDGEGVLTFEGSGGVTGTIGDGHALAEVNFNGAGVVELKDTANATDFNINHKAVNVIATGLMSGNVNFNATGRLVASDGIMGGVNFKGNAGTIVLGNDQTITGAVTAGGAGVGILNFAGAGTVTGTIGAGNALAKVNFGGTKTGVVELQDAATATNFNINNDKITVNAKGLMTGKVTFNGTGKLKADAGIMGDVDFHGNGGTITLGNGQTITGAVDSTVGEVGKGTLNFAGVGTVTRAIGATKALAAVNFGDAAGGGAVELRGAATAINFNINNAAADITARGLMKGNVNFNAAGNLNADLGITGNVNFQGHAGTITLGAGQTITGAITAGEVGKGTLNFAGVGTVTSAIGATKALAAVNFGDAAGGGAVELRGAATAINFNINNAAADITARGLMKGNVNFNAAGNLNADLGITGNVNFQGHAGTITLGAGQTITGAITAGGVGTGTLTFAGIGTVTGDIGTNAERLARIDIAGATTLGGSVYTNDLHFDNAAAHVVTISGDFAGGVTFDVANAGTLTFNGAAGPYTFNSTIANGHHGTLNVNANLQATHKNIGKIKTINIGDAVGGAKTLKIDASAADVTLRGNGGGGGQVINFLHADSVLHLYSAVNKKTITFANNLPGRAAGEGIVWLEGAAGNTLTVSSVGGMKTLGTANTLKELQVRGHVTITGDDTPAVNNKLDVHNANILNIMKGARFTDESTTSAQIANIHIGADSAGGVAVGAATYILDAKYGIFDLNANRADQIVFDHADAQLTLRNSAADNKTITLVNNLNPGADGKGIVELDSVVDGKTLTIAGAGLSLGTGGNNLKKVIFSGAGKFNTQQITIYSKNIELNVNELTLGAVNSNILFATNTVLTANGDITGNVDFQNNDGTVRLAPTKNIIGSVTSTSTGDAKGTLEFLGIGTVTGPITNLKMLKAGAGNVKLAGVNHTITEIQGNGNNDLIFATNCNLTGSINSTGGTAVGLIFKGNNGVTGVVGMDKNPVGTIQVQGTTVFSDKVQTANDQDIIIFADATAEFANAVTTRDIKGAADGQGTVTFNNTTPITINSTIGAGNSVYTLEIAGADVAITQAVSAKNISFSNAKEATLTLNGTSTVDGSISTVGNNVHTLALAADFTIGEQHVGSEKNRLKSIKLLGDHKITIKSGVYSDVSTKDNNTGKVVFNSDRSFAYNLGTEKLRLSDVTFDNNATVKGDVYSKQITIASDKTATFAGTKNRTIFVPNLTVDGSSLSRSLKRFAYSTQIVSDEIKNAGIAKFDNAVLVDAKINGGKVTFADNVWFKQTADGKEVNFAANKYVILEQNINFANIKADQAKIIILPKTASITGNLAAKDFTVDLAANKLKYTGQAQLTGKIELVTAYDTSSGAGGNIEVQTGSKLDLSKADQLVIKVNARTDINKIPKGGVQYFVISSVDGKGLVAIDNSKVSLDSTGEQNRFVKWSMDSSDLKLYITDISKEVIAKEIADTSLPQEYREFYIQLNNVTDRNSSAAQFMNNIGRMDREHALQAMDRILPGNEHPIGESLARNPTSEIIGGLIAQADTQITATRMGNSVPMQNPESDVDSGQNSASALGSGDDDTLRYGVWGSPFYGTACQETYKGVSGYKSKSAGGIVGFDGLVNDNLLLGAAYSRINTQMSHQDRKVGDKTNGKTNIFSLYSLYNFPNNWFTEAIASYGITRVKNSEGRLISTNVRNVTALETAAAKYKSISYSGQLLAGYNYRASEKLMITPTIGFRYLQFKDAGYTETGTKFQNLAVKKRSYNKLEGILGLRTATTLKVNKVLLIPELHGYVNHDFRGKAPIIDARLDGINEPLPTRLVKPAKTSFTIGTGLTVKYDIMECGVTYNANIASKYIGHQGSLKVKVNF